MTKFKTGDTVVRTIGFSGNDDGFMEVGSKYTVVGYINESMLLVVGSKHEYNDLTFELVEEKPVFKNMKFRVNSPEHSKEIQEALFEMGYKWYGQEVAEMIDSEYSEYSFMYSYEDGTITHSPKHYMFMENTHSQEYTVETTKSYKLIPVVTKVTVESSKPETIEIDGKTYDKEAVLKRLAELETVE